ncbi:MAG TPA: hypothetical protein VHU40_00545 [Polyangia bacterium]|nr:hypothetical protein [Polyangia bacterium]
MSAGLVGFALLIAFLALLVRAERQIRGALRYVGRWVVRGGWWVAARWDAWHAGCPHCDHCHPDTAHRAPGPRYMPARLDGETR